MLESVYRPDLRQEPGSTRVTGTFSLFGGSAPIEAETGSGALVVTSVGGTGTLTVYEHGYFSGRTRTLRELVIRGSFRQGALTLRAWDEEADPANAVAGSALRRGEYLVLRLDSGESVYAPHGR